MEESWQVIYAAKFEHNAEIVRAVLEDNGISAIVLNKKDSAYLFGEVEVYVKPDDVMKAKMIINTNNL